LDRLDSFAKTPVANQFVTICQLVLDVFKWRSSDHDRGRTAQQPAAIAMEEMRSHDRSNRPKV
jgi:hypothetical protein